MYYIYFYIYLYGVPPRIASRCAAIRGAFLGRKPQHKYWGPLVVYAVFVSLRHTAFWQNVLGGTDRVPEFESEKHFCGFV